MLTFADDFFEELAADSVQIFALKKSFMFCKEGFKFIEKNEWEVQHSHLPPLLDSATQHLPL